MIQWRDEEYIDEIFEDVDFTMAELRDCRFTRCQFRGAQMDEMITQGCRFNECDFTGAHFNGSMHTETAFTNCQFTGANLFVTKFTGCKMTGSSFLEANFNGITITGGDWAYTNLRKQDLRGQKLRGVLFTEADLYES
ncbi:MAG: pentapeptide repeat-containing protein, partial [Tumebacillaceae bacterium]